MILSQIAFARGACGGLARILMPSAAVTPRARHRWRRAAAEILGTGALAAVVVGSGIMASRLSPGDTGLELLENSLATALGLAVIIAVPARSRERT
jgi:hypothetical protein